MSVSKTEDEGSSPYLGAKLKTNNMTQGEKVIRPDFAKSEEVKKIKQMYAELYDTVLASVTWNNVTPENREANRLAQRALDDLETSAMFAVKALTV